MQCGEMLLRGCTSQVGAWAEITSPYQTSRPGTQGHCWRGTAGCSTTSDVSICASSKQALNPYSQLYLGCGIKCQTASTASTCCLHKVKFLSVPARDLLPRGKIVGHLCSLSAAVITVVTPGGPQNKPFGATALLLMASACPPARAQFWAPTSTCSCSACAHAETQRSTLQHVPRGTNDTTRTQSSHIPLACMSRHAVALACLLFIKLKALL